MHLDQKISLKALNTFGLDVEARYFVEAKTKEDIHTLLNYRSMIFLPVLIIGGGSNILFTGNFNGLAIYVNNKGIQVIDEDTESVVINVQAGELWDDFVLYSVENGWSGLEKLSLIPGRVGAAPIQNIGAYGSEVRETIERVDFVDIRNGSAHSLVNAQCNFGYRDSIFKHELKGRFIITDVTFRLNKAGSSGLVSAESLNYKDLRDELQSRGIHHPSLSEIRDTVISIRQRKLPEPKITGNAGSFFKNPVISGEVLKKLLSSKPGIPHFPEPGGSYFKIPAARLIEECGWKGFRDGDAGVHENQPLVLVNYGNATGKEILQLSEKIRDSVRENFGVNLEPEVNII